MFPNYMNDMLKDPRCGHCDAAQTVANIQTVGIRRPEEFEAFYGDPIFVIIMDCKNCGQWTNHTMRRSRADAIAGCNAFIDLVENECEGKKPPINIPGLGKKSPASPAAAAHSAAAQPLRPSIREGQPDTPPTQREVQYFLHRLRKVTFKPGSKDVHDWLKDLGAGTDAGEWPPNDREDHDQS